MKPSCTGSVSACEGPSAYAKSPLPSGNYSGTGKRSQNQIGGYEYFDGPDPAQLSAAADKYYYRYASYETDPYLANLLAILAACDQADVVCSRPFMDGVNSTYGLIIAARDPNCNAACYELAREAVAHGDVVSDFAAPAGAGAVAASGIRRGVFGTRRTDVDDRINEVVNFYDMHGRPPTGTYQGGLPNHRPGTYGNRNGRLPSRPLGYYTESDIWPSGTLPGGRGSERLVFGDRGEVYYTYDHYDNFIRLR